MFVYTSFLDDRGRLQNQKNLDELKGMVRNLRQTMSRSLEVRCCTNFFKKYKLIIRKLGKSDIE